MVVSIITREVARQQVEVRENSIFHRVIMVLYLLMLMSIHIEMY
jgi:hypothetical protein